MSAINMSISTLIVAQSRAVSKLVIQLPAVIDLGYNSQNYNLSLFQASGWQAL